MPFIGWLLGTVRVVEGGAYDRPGIGTRLYRGNPSRCGLSVPRAAPRRPHSYSGTGLQAASWLIFAEPDSAARYIWIAANPGPAEVAKVFDVLAIPFLIGAVVVYVMLGRQRSPRLAWMAACSWGPDWSD